MDDSRKLAVAQREWSEKEQELQRKHAAELGKLREQLEIEKEQWMLHVEFDVLLFSFLTSRNLKMTDKMEKERKQAEALAFQEMERQRDEEIELVILR